MKSTGSLDETQEEDKCACAERLGPRGLGRRGRRPAEHGLCRRADERKPTVERGEAPISPMREPRKSNGSRSMRGDPRDKGEQERDQGLEGRGAHAQTQQDGAWVVGTGVPAAMIKRCMARITEKTIKTPAVEGGDAACCPSRAAKLKPMGGRTPRRGPRSTGSRLGGTAKRKCPLRISRAETRPARGPRRSAPRNTKTDARPVSRESPGHRLSRSQ